MGLMDPECVHTLWRYKMSHFTFVQKYKNQIYALAKNRWKFRVSLGVKNKSVQSFHIRCFSDGGIILWQETNFVLPVSTLFFFFINIRIEC